MKPLALASLFCFLPTILSAAPPPAPAPAEPVAMKAHLTARFEIESGFDYLYVQTSVDGGATWQDRDGTIDGSRRGPYPRSRLTIPAGPGTLGGMSTPETVSALRLLLL